MTALRAPAHRRTTAPALPVNTDNAVGKAPRWHKVAPIALETNTSRTMALAAIATACRDHWLNNLDAAIAGSHPEGVHQVRVGFRRFRVVLTLYRDQLPAEQYAWLNMEAKAFCDGLGPVRDLDVFVTDLMTPFIEAAAKEPDMTVLLTAARRAQGDAHADAAALLQSPRYHRFMVRLNAWLTGKGWRLDKTRKDRCTAEDFAKRVFNQRFEKIVRRCTSITGLPPAKLHRLRIATKKLRYGMEFFRAVLPKRRAMRLARLLKSLQDALGHMNDLDVAKRTVAMLEVNASDAQTRIAIRRAGKRLAARFDAKANAALPKAVLAAARLDSQKAF